MTKPEIPPLPPGTMLARGYEVVGHLSRGKTLDVYDVWSAARRCRCVAKTVRPDRAGTLRYTRRLALEGRLLRRLTHPHIVRAYETVWGGSPRRPVIVMETLKGHTLAYLIDQYGRLAPGDCALLGVHLSAALVYLHEQGFLHRDLKPSNVVCEAGRAKLIDLGLARRPRQGGSRDGTREYMAPEQALGEPLTGTVDVWGLGVVLFEALTGTLPFGEHPVEGEEDDDEFSSQLEGPQQELRIRASTLSTRRAPRRQWGPCNPSQQASPSPSTPA